MQTQAVCSDLDGVHSETGPAGSSLQRAQDMQVNRQQSLTKDEHDMATYPKRRVHRPLTVSVTQLYFLIGGEMHSVSLQCKSRWWWTP